MSNLTLKSLTPASTKKLPDSKYTYVGIDFGTSTTVLSIIEMEGGQIRATSLPISQAFQNGTSIQDEKVPTCIAYSKKYNELYFGAGAYEARFDPRLEPGKNVWFEFKTLLGEDLGPRYSNTVLDGKEGRKKLETALDATSLFLDYISGQVRQEIKRRNLPGQIHWAVSVPASFEANQRRDLIKALEIAGIENIGESLLIDEPNAAFLSYVEQSGRLEGQEPLNVPDGQPISALVFDFGAGTCDISILQFQQDDFSGVTSKNVAISHYTEIGGKDIDKIIADSLINHLTPLEKGTPPIGEITSRVKERLSGQLLRISEQMKIELCKQVMFHHPQKDKSSFFSTIGLSPQVKDHKNRIYELNKPKLTYDLMAEIMTHFTNRDQAKSIFKPIDSALQSAGLKKNEIDYVLFVGGSAQNPWIQNAIKNYFQDADYLFPRNMQTLVSQGAAIHSYYFNGLKHRLIKPITGPTINLRLADGEMVILVPSGTEIPYQGREIQGLRPQRDNQEAIELPVCLSSDSYILQNLRIEPENRSGFSLGDFVSLSVKITADKTLHVAAKVSSGEAIVTQLNPYSSKALSTGERIVAEGKKRFNQEVRKRGGTASASAFLDLGKAYEKAEQRKDAAEMMEEAYLIEPHRVSLNNLAVAWSNAGDVQRAVKFYKMAIEKKDVYAMVNLSTHMQWSNPEEYKRLLNEAFKLDPTDTWVLFNYGRMLKNRGDLQWKVYWDQCLRAYMQKAALHRLGRDDTDRAIIISEALVRPEDLSKLKAYKTTLPVEDHVFSEANTVTRTSEFRLNTSATKAITNK